MPVAASLDVAGRQRMVLTVVGTAGGALGAAHRAEEMPAPVAGGDDGQRRLADGARRSLVDPARHAVDLVTEPRRPGSTSPGMLAGGGHLDHFDRIVDQLGENQVELDREPVAVDQLLDLRLPSGV